MGGFGAILALPLHRLFWTGREFEVPCRSSHLLPSSCVPPETSGLPMSHHSLCLAIFLAAFSTTFLNAADRRPEPPPLPEAGVQDENAGPPLHPRIDSLIENSRHDFSKIAAPICSDAEFFRRVSLDLIGTVPSAAESRDFLADKTPSAAKRAALVDQLLASPRHARRLQYIVDEMVMERRGGSNVPDAEWRNWLRRSIRENRRWDAIVEEILAADGAEAEKRPAAKFYLDRNFDVDLVTRDVGRIFLGVDLECAQCHDHPSIDGYLQRHYYGISAFLKRSYVFTDPKSKKKMLGEKAEGDVKFTSVFTSVEGMTNPRLLDLPQISDPDGTEKAYVAKPASKVRGVPKYSRRLQLPLSMISDENVDFRRNIVNRLWAVMMGRGLVEPLDVRHADNPPTHPEVLTLLADEFLKHDYDVRWLLRELALSKTYQRGRTGGELSGEVAESYATTRLKALSPEQLAWSVMDVTGVAAQTLEAKKAELLKKDAKTGESKVADPIWREETLHDALKANVDQFVVTFAGQGGQKTGFDSSADQALFLLNGSLVQKWLVPANGNLTDRLRKLDDPATFAEELYMSILNRPPAEDEVAAVTGYLKKVLDRDSAAQELAWALMTSAEFRFNH
jgi:hypothetical protein